MDSLAEFGRAWAWSDISRSVEVDRYPLVRQFVERLRDRGMDRVIYGASSIDGLFLSMTPTWPYNGDVLRVSAMTTGAASAGGRLTYMASARDSLSTEYAWDQAYDSFDLLWQAFERFLVRAHWLPKEHPLLRDGVT